MNVAAGDPRDLADRLETVVPAALRRTGTPGAVVHVRHGGRTLVRGAWGDARRTDREQPLPVPVPMRLDTVFDVASITKVAATTAVAMVLADDGRLDLDLAVGDVVPGFHGGGREQVTVAHLLAHRSGLPDWAPLFLRARDRDAATAALCAVPLVAEPGDTYAYSDLGMMLLGLALEPLGGAPLDELAHERVFAPLGMTATGFGPLTGDRVAGCAATSTGNPVEARMVRERTAERDGDPSWWRDRTLVGEVNDANAAIAFSGVAGHAGLFADADDLVRFGTELLDAVRGRSTAVFDAEVVRRFTSAGPHPGQGLGFWTGRIATDLGRGAPTSETSFGHRGFTGCELLVAPDHELVVVLLSNRLHGGDPPPEHHPLWSAVLGTVLDALGDGR